LDAHDGATTYTLRRRLAGAAYALTASYDSHIASWFAQQNDADSYPAFAAVTGTRSQSLRYGENPHQQAGVYLDGSQRPGIALSTQLQGKELSYNNFNDTDAAFELVAEFSEPAVAIIKHANPCGVAVAADTLTAYQNALRCDSVSAFGGIIALNRPLDGPTAAEIVKIFCEVIIAPSINDDARKILAAKTNVRVLTTGAMPDPFTKRRLIKTIAGGFLLQDADTGHITAADLQVVTKRAPSDAEINDMLFAFTVAKHVKSNAIIYAKDNCTVGIGAGQMSRIDSTRIAAHKARGAAHMIGMDATLTTNSVVASDAFFPFADGLIAAAEAGATAIIQPGGSIRDDEVIKAANDRGLAMVFTGMRHFRH
ncbi:MAG: bifunctional phosphoribosylaminoimidazolecarboxamide formyltransferase/IMP cyclohydrolase, partial [Alphaproteobacteria bacterium]|nr:bifunctional phosphoribosylaminoimidazolecarboxamide formyltransferase/IMP cyclohydrolase [Alphaproteobacteria bacterium]